MRNRCLGFPVLCALTLSVVPAQADLRTTPANLWVTGPRTNTVVRAGERLFVGGSFTSVYPVSHYTGWLATFEPGSEAARALPALSGGYSGVTALTDDGAGGWFVAGDFRRAGDTDLGVLTVPLIRVRQDGSVQRLVTDASAALYNGIVGLARSGNTLFVVFYRYLYLKGRTYSSYDLAAFDVPTGIRRAPDIPLGANYSAITTDHSRVYVFGTFTTIAGGTRTNAAAFDAATLALTPWAPPAPASVRAAHVHDATVYVAGEFSAVGATGRAGLAAFSTIDGSLQPWAPSAQCSVSAITATIDRVYLGGCGTTTGTTQGLVTAVDRVTGAATGWAATLDGPVRSMGSEGPTLYIGGRFSSVAGQSRLNAASFTNGVLTGWNPRPAEAVASVAATPGGVAIGGEFTGLGAVQRTGVAEFDARTGSLTAWEPPLLTRPYVSTLATDGRWLFILGSLEGPAGCTPSCGMMAVALDGSTTIPVQEGLAGVSVATARDRLYLGHYDGVIGIDTSTGRILPWRAPVNVWGPMVATEDFVYATPSSVGGAPTLTKIDARTGAILPWSPGAVQPSVVGLATYGSWLLVGRTWYPEDLSALVAVDQETGRLMAEAPRSLVPGIDQFGLQTTRGGPVVTPRGILISSNATIIGVQPSGSRLPWSVGIDGLVFTLHGDERGVVVTGNFVRAGGVVSPGLAIFPEQVPPAPSDLATTVAGSAVHLQWERPSDGDPVDYRLEAGTVPGATDIGAWTLPPTPSYDVAGVPDGRYVVRVRAATGAGVGPPSNEVEVIVGVPQPRAPTGLVAAVDAQTVSLTWSAVDGPLDQYVLDVGSAPGVSNLVRGAPLGPVTSARFERVPTGTYYVRVRAINRTGSSPPSAELTVIVAGTAAHRTR